MNKKFISSRQTGFSLIELLIAFTILGILMLAMLSFQSNQIKQNKMLTEKLASLDVTRIITSALANADICKAIFDASNLVDPSAIPFDKTTLSVTSPHYISVKQIPAAAVGVSAPPLLVAGEAASPVTDSLMVSEVSASPAGLRIKVTSPVTASLQVNFNREKLSGPLRDLEFPLILWTTEASGNLSIEGCASSSAPLRVEGNQYIAPGNCSGSSSGGFCNAPFWTDVTFVTPFNSPPKVLVAASYATDGTFCSCCNGSVDHFSAYATNVTSTGFRLHAGGSPADSASCGAPYNGWNVRIPVSWIAVGN